MTQKEKQLLLKDLCARLPYRVKIFHNLSEKPVTFNSGHLNQIGVYKIKPYLRPMSSMTEEEADEFEKISNELLENGENTEIWDTVVDWLNANYFDHRGLIPMGLALEAKEGMYKIE